MTPTVSSPRPLTPVGASPMLTNLGHAFRRRSRFGAEHVAARQENRVKISRLLHVSNSGVLAGFIGSVASYNQQLTRYQHRWRVQIPPSAPIHRQCLRLDSPTENHTRLTADGLLPQNPTNQCC